jgi:hypothetical protein
VEIVPMAKDTTGRNGRQGGSDKPNSSRIQEIAGGSMYAAADLSSVAYVVMNQIAISGSFYMPAAQLAALIYRLRPDVCRGGKPPTRETIYHIWRRLEDRELIKWIGYRRCGVKVWEIRSDTALECYARFCDAWRDVSGVGFSTH